MFNTTAGTRDGKNEADGHSVAVSSGMGAKVDLAFKGDYYSFRTHPAAHLVVIIVSIPRVGTDFFQVQRFMYMDKRDRNVDRRMFC